MTTGIEAALDCLAETIAAATVDVDAFRGVYELCVRHYEREEVFVRRCFAMSPPGIGPRKWNVVYCCMREALAAVVLVRVQPFDGLYSVRLAARFAVFTPRSF